MKVYIVVEDYESNDHGDIITSSDIVAVFENPEDAKKCINDFKDINSSAFSSRFSKNIKIISANTEHDGWWVDIKINKNETFTYRCVEEEVQ